MSSHREAPAISQDPVADNADTYAFVSPDDPTTVTIITNYVPLEGPPGGPNFFEFGDDVLYSIYVDSDDDRGPGRVLGVDLACPPCNIGPRSTPDYEALAAAAVHSLPGGISVFAGQRNDGFFVDLGAI